MLWFQFHASPMTQSMEPGDKLTVFPGSHTSWSFSCTNLLPWIPAIPQAGALMT